MLLVAGAVVAFALSDVPELQAQHTSVPPVIDGKLGDAAWSTAPGALQFTQKSPLEGQPASERTRLWVAYDDVALYVGFDCEQLHAPIIGRLTKRDAELTSDAVSIDLGSKADGRSAFEFSVSAAGVLGDGIRYDDTELSSEWDENWQAKTATRAHGWSAEFRIPLRILRFAGAGSSTWDFQARRHIAAAQETDEWRFIPRHVGGEVSQYGKLTGLLDLVSEPSMELRQSLLAQIRRLDAGGASGSDRVHARLSPGVELKYHVSQELTLDATINPDFAQIEADEQLLNLANIELRLPEKRPFFLEGSDLFASPKELVYTRRIGQAPASPNVLGSLPFGERLSDVPDPATIYGATKLTGKLGQRWDVGLLQVLVAPSELQVQSGDRQQRRRVEPLTSFNVLRVRREVERHGYIGLTLTATERLEGRQGLLVEPDPEEGGGLHKLCGSGQLVLPALNCFNDAYVAGLDLHWRQPDGDWFVKGQLMASLLSGGPPRQSLDGTRVRPGEVGSGAFLFLEKDGGDHLVGDAFLEYASKKLDYSDLGYQERANLFGWNAKLEYRELQPHGPFLESHVHAAQWGATNLSGLPLERGVELGAHGTLRNFWQYVFVASYLPPQYDDREVGDGTALQRARRVGFDFSLESNPSQPLSLELRAQYSWIRTGLEALGRAKLTLRPTPELSLELAPALSYAHGEPRYAGDGAEPRERIFGRLDARSVSSELRVSYTFLPELTLQAYAQLFLAAGHYAELLSHPAALDGTPAKVRLKELRPYPSPLDFNPDFEQAAANINLVLRWEYVTGSTLALVYTRARDPNAALGPAEKGTLDLFAVRRAPAVDAVAFKLSSWWGN